MTDYQIPMPCGTKFISTDPQTGGRFSNTYRCHRFRECEKCMLIRIKREQAIFADYAEFHQYRKGTIIRVSFFGEDKEAASKFVRRMRYHDLPYRRYPSEKTGIVIVHFSDIGERAATMLFTDFINAPFEWWEKLVWTEDGCCVSSRGIKGVAREERGEQKVEVTCVKSNAPEAEKDAYQDAVKETEYLDPQTIEELQEALDCRARIFIKLLKETGADVFCIIKRSQYVNMKNANWQRETSVEGFFRVTGGESQQPELEEGK